jgi:tRNA modification GTPase
MVFHQEDGTGPRQSVVLTGGETICAVATPAGRGGVSVIRISGPSSFAFCHSITGKTPVPNTMLKAGIRDADGELIDEGLAVCFKAPHSFTGEDVCELHTHGSPIVTKLVLERLVSLGARLARPGEFSERAFLGGKIDLAQAEAIADLINSSSNTAARFAIRSLQGEFSRRIHALVDTLTNLRVYLEAALDFPEEEVDFLAEGDIAGRVDTLLADLESILRNARQGALVREGIQVAIVGEPNVGKSTLLNSLTGEDAAIVTDIPGTTRDILRQSIDLGGLPVHLLDTAGLRNSTDVVEQEGIRRARKAIEDADVILFMIDNRHALTLPSLPIWQELAGNPRYRSRLLPVLNKIDLQQKVPAAESIEGLQGLAISALSHAGIDLLKSRLKELAGFSTEAEGGFLARQRHILALESARHSLQQGQSLLNGSAAAELLAEELKQAQHALGEITGKVSSDTLLGLIFSSFCIGK